MAAIDFPASPTNGQLFTASNNVVYQWQASPGMWIAIGNVGAQADFHASGSAALSNASTTIIFNQVNTGNSGGWYSTSTGRFTPPQGRYAISAGFSIPPSAVANCQITLRKNGVALPGGLTNTSPGAAGLNAGVTISSEVDFNGLDWVDVQGVLGGTTTGNTTAAWFMAVPVFSALGSQAFPPTPVGDFMAKNSVAIGVGAALVKVTMDTIVTGNSGGWYSTSTGRYTPPPGRFYISWTPGTLGNAQAAATIAWAYLYKNGVQVAQAGQVPAGANWYGDPEARGIFDCNGTDYFETYVQANAAGVTVGAQTGSFLAFPLGGAVGPQGPPGIAPAGNYWRQLKRVVPTAGQATIDFTSADIPSDINNIEIRFDVSPQTNDTHLNLQFFDAAGVIDATINHYAWSNITNWNSNPSTTTISDVTSAMGNITNYITVDYGYTPNGGINNTAGQGGAGRIEVNNIRDTNRAKHAIYQCDQLAGSAAYVAATTGGGWRNQIGAITGTRLFFTTGGFQAGGAVTLYGSP